MFTTEKTGTLSTQSFECAHLHHYAAALFIHACPIVKERRKTLTARDMRKRNASNHHASRDGVFHRIAHSKATTK